MFCLYNVYYIEDYYRLRSVVCVSNDEQKLKDYIVTANQQYQEKLSLFNRYIEINKQLKEIVESLPSEKITMPTPLPNIKGPFTPEQKAERQKLNDAYNAAMMQYYDRFNLEAQAKQDKAIKQYCEQNSVDETSLDRNQLFVWLPKPEEPEFEIDQVKEI